MRAPTIAPSGASDLASRGYVHPASAVAGCRCIWPGRRPDRGVRPGPATGAAASAAPDLADALIDEQQALMLPDCGRPIVSVEIGVGRVDGARIPGALV
jgi:hypothetical protein